METEGDGDVVLWGCNGGFSVFESPFIVGSEEEVSDCRAQVERLKG